MLNNKEIPAIYVACLASYNNNLLYGLWIDADKGSEYIEQQIHNMLAASPMYLAEEWAIHDYEYFGKVKLSEYMSVNDVSDIAQFIIQYGDVGSIILNYYNNDVKFAISVMESGYCGHWDCINDYVQDYYVIDNLPNGLDRYIDLNAIWNDIRHDYLVLEAEQGVYIFNTI
jgi:antirestriction protein